MADNDGERCSACVRQRTGQRYHRAAVASMFANDEAPSRSAWSPRSEDRSASPAQARQATARAWDQVQPLNLVWRSCQSSSSSSRSCRQSIIGGRARGFVAFRKPPAARVCFVGRAGSALGNARKRWGHSLVGHRLSLSPLQPSKPRPSFSLPARFAADACVRFGSGAAAPLFA